MEIGNVKDVVTFQDLHVGLNVDKLLMQCWFAEDVKPSLMSTAEFIKFKFGSMCCFRKYPLPPPPPPQGGLLA